jgi:hypothetical protein
MGRRRREATMRSGETVTIDAQQLLREQLVEVAFPGWPSPIWMARAVAPAAPRSWATQREAGAAAAAVAIAVVVPVLIAVGTVVTTFVLTSAVLLAPVVAIALAWIAWRCNEKAPLGAEGDRRLPPAPPTPAQP